jgi:glycosyltransferase involved in cell wall biosynthesis
MKSDKPLVSIGVPVRNGARFLGQTLDSLLGQTYRDFELIISDNASTDETEAICRDFASQDGRIRYYRVTQDLGLAYNYNFLFKQARGEYFKWAAADDLCEPEYVARCLDVLESDRATVLAYTKTRFIDETQNPVTIHDPGFDLHSSEASERLRYVIYAGNWVNAIYGVIRSAALTKTQLLPPYPGGDYTLLGDLAVAGKFVEVPQALFLRRLHAGASSQNLNVAHWLAQYWTGDGQLCLPFWSRSHGHFRTIVRSDLKLAEKLSLGGSLLRTMVAGRRRLFEELKAASFLKLQTRS